MGLVPLHIHDEYAGVRVRARFATNKECQSVPCGDIFVKGVAPCEGATVQDEKVWVPVPAALAPRLLAD